MGKPTICIGKNKGADQKLISTFVFFHSDSTIPLLFMPPTSKKLRGHIGLGLSVQSSPVVCSESVMCE